MRSIGLMLLFLVVACGDNRAAPDGHIGPRFDSGGGDDDDAPVGDDAPPAGAAQIWVVGDFLTNGRLQAGSFQSDAAFPFGTATPPPLVVPNGATDGLLATGATANVFDAKGGKIAYVADQTVAGRFDLNVANADGTSPIVVVQGGTINVEITSVALSPDGTKVAFTQDSVLINGGFDLYVAPTTANATPVQISPARPITAVTPANQDVFFQFEWSPDSKFVAFSGDLDTDGFDQAYVTDTTAATPTAVEILTKAEIATQASGAQGVRGKILFDNANNLYFRARVSTANNSQFTFFKSDTAGVKTTITTPARADSSVSDIGAFGITPDGTTLVFSADSPAVNTFNLFAAPIANPTTTTNLTNLTPDANGAVLRADFTTPLFMSPDSKKVAVIANFISGSANAFEPFVIQVDGSGSKRLAQLSVLNSDAELIVWANNSTVFVQGDLAVNNDSATFELDATTTDQTPTLAVGVATGGDMVNLFVVP